MEEKNEGGIYITAKIKITAKKTKVFKGLDDNVTEAFNNIEILSLKNALDYHEDLDHKNMGYEYEYNEKDKSYSLVFSKIKENSNNEWDSEIRISFKKDFLEKENVSLKQMFQGCSSLTELDLSHFNTINVTDMESMFAGCSSLIKIDFGNNFYTQNVTNMYSMFAGCSKLNNLDLTKFNTQNVTNMSYMFWGCENLINLDLSKFDTTNVTGMVFMFRGCSELKEIKFPEILNLANVADMDSMFYACKNLITFSNTKILVLASRVKLAQKTSEMFKNVSFLVDPTKTKESFLSFFGKNRPTVMTIDEYTTYLESFKNQNPSADDILSYYNNNILKKSPENNDNDYNNNSDDNNIYNNYNNNSDDNNIYNDLYSNNTINKNNNIFQKNNEYIHPIFQNNNNFNNNETIENIINNKTNSINTENFSKDSTKKSWWRKYCPC